MGFGKAFLTVMALVMASVFVSAANDAQCISSSIPQFIVADENYNVSVTLKNTGTEAWNDTNKYTLRSLQGTTFGSASSGMAIGSGSVVPLDSKAFSFSIKAPSGAGNYEALWQMDRNATLFGQSCGRASITVVRPNPPANTSPAITNVPDVQFAINSNARANITDLWAYATDAEDSDDRLTFTINSQSNPGLISCTINNNRYVSCNAPTQNQTGSNTITVQAMDTNGASASDVFVATVSGNPGNNAPVLSGIPDLDTRENSGSRNDAIDLWAYASDAEDADNRLSFAVTSQSNSSLVNCFVDSQRFIDCDAPSTNRTGTNSISVRVTDTSGLSATDTFDVRVFSEGTGNSSPSISGLPDIDIRENDGYNSRLIDLFSYARDDFDSDDQLDFRISRQSDTSLVFCRIVGDRYFECEGPRGNSTGESTITIEVENTRNRVDSDTFTVNVGGQGNGTCSDISVSTSTVFMDEDETKNVSFSVRNDSDQDFEVTDAGISDNSSYLKAENFDAPASISANDSSDLSMDLVSTNTVQDREATVTLKLKGEFSDGRKCSLGSVTKSFRVEINNNGSSSGSGSAACNDITLSAPDVSVNEDSKTTKNVRIENSSNRTFSIDSVKVEDASPKFSARVKSKPSSVGRNSGETIGVEISAGSVSSGTRGSVDVSVAGRFSDGRYCSASAISDNFYVTVEDSSRQPPSPQPAPQPQPAPAEPEKRAPEVRVSAKPDTVSGAGKIELENTGDDLTNVTITAIGVPAGVKVGALQKQLWRTGEKVEVAVDAKDYEGKVEATFRVNADSGSKSIPVSFDAKKAQAQGSGATGFASLASTVGMAVGGIVLVVLAVIGVLSLLKAN